MYVAEDSTAEAEGAEATVVEAAGITEATTDEEAEAKAVEATTGRNQSSR